MRLILTGIIVIILTFISTPKAHAIIFLPALILIPIAKIIALIVGGLALPTLGIGTVGGKLYNKPVVKIIFALTIIILLFALALAVFLKIQNPDRPFI